MEVLFSEEEIREKVQEIAQRIASDYKGKELNLVVVMMGAMVFCSDLMRAISSYGGSRLTLGIVKAKSYVGQESRGNVLIDIGFDCKGKNILIVEDIADTGSTLSQLKEEMLARGAREVKTCSLLDKPSRRRTGIQIDYLGFTIPDLFVVGYGLDLDGMHRELPYIAVITPEK